MGARGYQPIERKKESIQGIALKRDYSICKIQLRKNKADKKHSRLWGHYCVQCGSQFPSYNPNAKFCHTKCYLNYLAENTQGKIHCYCKWCNKRFRKSAQFTRTIIGNFCNWKCWSMYLKAKRELCDKCHHYFSPNMKKLHEWWCESFIEKERIQKKKDKRELEDYIESYIPPKGLEGYEIPIPQKYRYLLNDSD